jgi:hypothetical protein
MNKKNPCEIEGCENPTHGADRCDEHMFVTCPQCGNEQADMGNNVLCESCDNGPMPTF